MLDLLENGQLSQNLRWDLSVIAETFTVDDLNGNPVFDGFVVGFKDLAIGALTDLLDGF